MTWDIYNLYGLILIAGWFTALWIIWRYKL